MKKKSIALGSMLVFALMWIRSGYRVLPLFGIIDGKCECGDNDCARPGKHPRLKGGVNSATPDRSIVGNWFRKWPHANFGLATGDKGLFVLDIDGDAGRKSLAALERVYGPLPATYTVTSGRGEHRYFLTKETIKNSAGTRLGPGLDVRGEGGYVLMEGSRHVSGYVYARATRELGISVAPAWAVDSLIPRDTKAVPTIDPSQVQEDSATRGRAAAWVEAALVAELERVRQAPIGSRNDTLNSASFKVGQLVDGDLLTVEAAESRLKQAASAAGLEMAEIKNTVRSGLTAGAKEPRRFEPSAGVEKDGQDPVLHDALTRELSALGETDSDLALRFAKRVKDRVVYTPGRDFLVFDGTVWREDAEKKRILIAQEVARAIEAESQFLVGTAEKSNRTRFSISSLSAGAINRMLGLAPSHIMVQGRLLDADDWVLNVENGTLDLRDGTLHPHRAGDLLTKKAAVKFDAAARCPRFDAFIKQMLGADQDLIRYVQKAVGLSLTGDVSHHLFFFVYGPGRAGKSTLVNLVRRILGDYGRHTTMDTFLFQKYGSSPLADLARLRGARMVTAIEANWDAQLNEALIKTITGGEPITARALYQNPSEFPATFKLWFVANDFPNVRGTAKAFWERARVMPFTVGIPLSERDMELSDKLFLEASGILNWAVEGCLAIQREGFVAPEAVQKAGGKWKQDADHIRKFADELLIQEEGQLTQSADMIDLYQKWCRSKGELPGTSSQLKARLSDYGLLHQRKHGVHYWVGVKVRTG